MYCTLLSAEDAQLIDLSNMPDSQAYICLIISLRGSLESFDTLYPLQGRTCPSRASLLALLAHCAYHVPAHCEVACCSCFVLLLPLPSIFIYLSPRRYECMCFFSGSQHYTILFPSLYAASFIFPSRICVLLARTRWSTHTLYAHRRVYNICPGCGIFYQHRSLPLHRSTWLGRLASPRGSTNSHWTR